MSLNVVLGDDHTIIKGDSVNRTGTIANVHSFCSYLRGGMVDLFQLCLKGMALDLVTDNVGVVVFGVLRATIGSDSVKCAGTIADVHRLSSYLRAKTSEMVALADAMPGKSLHYQRSSAETDDDEDNTD